MCHIHSQALSVLIRGMEIAVDASSLFPGLALFTHLTLTVALGMGIVVT